MNNESSIIKHTKKELVLEVGTEEIPSRFLCRALESLQDRAREGLESHSIEFDKIETLGTPRRLALLVSGVSAKQPDKSITVMGPPKRVAYDSDGKPTKAAIGFAKKEGVDVGELVLEKTLKGEYLAVKKHLLGRESEEILPEILPEIIKNIYFPKNMRFESSNYRFCRPIRWIGAVFGGTVVPFEVAGVASGNKSRGHRFLAPDEFSFTSIDEYKKSLESAFVVLDPSKRREIILKEAERAARECGGKLFVDEELLDEVTNLVEYPVPLAGEFDSKFLSLPREVLRTSMKKHQKYFSVSGDDGLLPYFVTVSNIAADNMELIKTGNERVLRARLTDALFFFAEDKKTDLASRLPKLKNVVYQKKLGSVYDKVMRVENICEMIVEKAEFPASPPTALAETTKRAALLCKCDLITELVGEFPDIQGVMGREYAMLSGEPEAVSTAIFEHYLPRFAGDVLPNSLPGIVLAVSDRLDTIIGCFGVGLIPSGTKDPNGLRRAGLGIISTLVEKCVYLGTEEVVFRLTKAQGFDNADKIIAFLKQRMEFFFSEKGYTFDAVDAVLSVASGNPFDASLRLEALTEFQKGDGFAALATSFKRVGNIIPSGFSGTVKPELFKHDAERGLFVAVQDVLDAYSASLKSKSYQKALTQISGLKEPVDSFFSDTMVMDKDRAVRDNRLSLLYLINGMFLRFADFSKLVNES